MKSYKKVVDDVISDIESVKGIVPDFYAPDKEAAKIANHVFSLAIGDIKNIPDGDFEKLTTYLDKFGNLSLCESPAEKHAYQFLYNLGKEKLDWRYLKMKGKHTRAPQKKQPISIDFTKML